MRHDPIAIYQGSPRFPTASAAAAAPADTPQRWLALVQQHGPAQAAAQVQGDFAVALTLPDGSVFMAVDRFAVRTLCYRIDAGTLRCAPRADTLAEGSNDLDPQAVFAQCAFRYLA